MLFKDYCKNIKKELSNLPGESAHLEMIPFRLPSSDYTHLYSTAKKSAVMCLLVPKQTETHIILIERQHDGGKHSGQISFPGGKKDLEDESLKMTALRETTEEIGISAEKIKVIGELTEIFIPVSNFLVQPFVGFVQEDFEFILSADEVKSVFTFSTSDLLNTKTKQNVDIVNHKGLKMKNIPSFILKGHVVWGATAIILNEFKTILKRI